ncbi:GSCFA domain-containing protein [Sphingomonas sabuli]|uniref:GSCFA domain-containing protein n=1 Tax=Sphingomonas sabuli TaxID=2764186 RepID=A0A7G9L2B3_9SPHN|nr:GSCFA domain-containing protein [Sphingomonas sabuli]QNM82762.1 GSCFA domain-containing protein [Sphingomonas sabuli]
MEGSVVGIGNCQVEVMIRIAGDALGLTPRFIHSNRFRADKAFASEVISDAQLVFANYGQLHAEVTQFIRDELGRSVPVLPAPKFYFIGFHPDVVLPSSVEGERRTLPLGNTNSAILLAAFRQGLSVGEAVTLFKDEVFEALGYYDAYPLAVRMLVKQCLRCGIDVRRFLPRWLNKGPFVYVPLHPRADVLRDVTVLLLQSVDLLGAGAKVDPGEDMFARNVIWPIYPEIGDRLGLPGNYVFMPKNTALKAEARFDPMDLQTFTERTFAIYAAEPPDYTCFSRHDDPNFHNLRRFLRSRARGSGRGNDNPYRGLPVTSWWAKAVAAPAMQAVDPVVGAKFTIGRTEKVATAGSCFAQHIAQRLTAAGLNYLVTEQAPPECADPASEDYGLFTARFGNIYTVRQLLQLAHRAYGAFVPETQLWPVGDDGFVDPFRPRIGAAPFATRDALERSRDVHFAAVREMFETADVFIFTLGLTEAWQAAADGAEVPLAPGVVGADVPQGAYVPVNHKVADVIADLHELIALFRQHNAAARIVLTVSPVPLIATFEAEHVLTATTYSKSVLRAAAGEVASHYDHVDYFPSFEIVTGSFTRGRYFDTDLRTVKAAGVDHVMGRFLHHYYGMGGTELPAASDSSRRLVAETQAGMNVVCDEEEIAARSVDRPPASPLAS